MTIFRRMYYYYKSVRTKALKTFKTDIFAPKSVPYHTPKYMVDSFQTKL